MRWEMRHVCKVRPISRWIIRRPKGEWGERFASPCLRLLKLQPAAAQAIAVAADDGLHRRQHPAHITIAVEQWIADHAHRMRCHAMG